MSASGKGPTVLASFAVFLLAGAAFSAASLAPWWQLVNDAYLLSFATFAVELCAGVALLAFLAARLAGRRAPGVAWSALASAAVLVPTWAWNRNGDIDVVMLHLDSLRADHCSVYGYERETTPRLSALVADRGVRFERFFSQSAGTDKSTPAMLASLYPSQFCDLESEGDAYAIPERFPLLSERLATRGWSCWAFSSNPQVNGERGYERGFTALEPWWQPPPRPHDLVARLRDHLETSPAARNFVFGLVLDPHMPYTPRAEFDLWHESGTPDFRSLKALHQRNVPRTTMMEAVVDLYDGEIREVDDALGALVDWLEESGRMDRTLLLLLADHGDKFDEHGEFGHSGLLYDDVTHIPLIATFPSPLRHPPLQPAVRNYAGLASHVDLVPTVLGFLGEPVLDEHVRGRDLVPFLYGKQPVPAGDVFSEELVEGLTVRALRTPTHKAMVWLRDDDLGEQMALFDLVADPDELAPIATGAGATTAGARELLASMRAEIDRRTADARGFFVPSQAPSLEVATIEALQAIGYTR